tara:strand:+ start:5636 stop:5779 length:144 start_codon:yes stop_codon:yes gene_type:complete
MNINQKLTEEYPKLLKTVQSNKSEEEKKTKIYEFIELLDFLVKELKK